MNLLFLSQGELPEWIRHSQDLLDNSISDYTYHSIVLTNSSSSKKYGWLSCLYHRIDSSIFGLSAFEGSTEDDKSLTRIDGSNFTDTEIASVISDSILEFDINAIVLWNVDMSRFKLNDYKVDIFFVNNFYDKDIESEIFSNVIKGIPTSRISLSYYNGFDSKVVQEIVTRTDRYSVRRTLHKLFCRLPFVLMKFLSSFKNLDSFPSLSIGESKTDVIRLSSFISFIWRSVKCRIKERSVIAHWELAIRYKKYSPIYNVDLSHFHKIKNEQNSFWADPFLILNEGRLFVFFEEYPYNTKKGVISFIELNNDAKVIDYCKVIEESYHLSFPMLYNQNDTVYMIPESCLNKTIDLYKASLFPYKWEKEKTLISGISAADSVVFFYDNTYWLFTCVSSSDVMEVYEDLYIYHANSIGTNWIAHPLNPIITDVRSGRMAGSIIRDDTGIFRIVQNGALGYGHSIDSYRITTLSKTHYSEEKVNNVLSPENGSELGVHTLNTLENASIIDVLINKR